MSSPLFVFWSELKGSLGALSTITKALFTAMNLLFEPFRAFCHLIVILGLLLSFGSLLGHSGLCLKQFGCPLRALG